MASNKTGMREAAGIGGSGLGSSLLKIVAIGFAGGAALIGGAKALGDALEGKQESDLKKFEERRAADREEVRRITSAESGNDPDFSE